MKTNTKKLTAASLLCAFAYIVMLISKVIPEVAGFLQLDLKDVVIVSGGFILGPASALIISFVDVLPVLGVGSVLVPWAVILLIGGHKGVGIGLLVMFAIIYLVRQYAEPKIVSTQMDVHPLITLIAMYAGLKLAGLLGLIFAPLIAFVVKTSYISFKKEKTVDNEK